MPIGKTLGLQLPQSLKLGPLLAVAGLLGVAVTLAEPALSVVKTAGSLIEEEQAPYLYMLLHKRWVGRGGVHHVLSLRTGNTL